uniref:(northern house mosquito) hypothetical protein n=1 Tax=Culex pipiens TaxID=7175 RepID=A0A8D8CN87_CULPI
MGFVTSGTSASVGKGSTLTRSCWSLECVIIRCARQGVILNAGRGSALGGIGASAWRGTSCPSLTGLSAFPCVMRSWWIASMGSAWRQIIAGVVWDSGWRGVVAFRCAIQAVSTRTAPILISALAGKVTAKRLNLTSASRRAILRASMATAWESTSARVTTGTER